MGFKEIWSYQKGLRLQKRNLNLKTITKLKELYPDFSMDYVLNISS